MVNQLSLILDKITKELKTILIIAIIILCLYIFIKFKGVRTIMLIALVVVTIVTGVCSTYYVGEYYFRQGATIGSIAQSLYNGNITKYERKDDYTFSYQQIGFKSTGQSKQYESKIVEQIEIDIDLSQQWTVYINNILCNNCSTINNEIKANFTQKFKNKDATLIMEDTLDISLVFNKKTLEIYIVTNGGDEAVSLWNTYLQKNNFELTIKKIDGYSEDLTLNEEPVTPYNYYEIIDKNTSDLNPNYSYIHIDNNILSQFIELACFDANFGEMYFVTHDNDGYKTQTISFVKNNLTPEHYLEYLNTVSSRLTTTLDKSRRLMPYLYLEVESPDAPLTKNYLVIRFALDNISLDGEQSIHVYINHLRGEHHAYLVSAYSSLEDYLNK